MKVKNFMVTTIWGGAFHRVNRSDFETLAEAENFATERIKFARSHTAKRGAMPTVHVWELKSSHKEQES